MNADCQLPDITCMWSDCTTFVERHVSAANDCGGCLGGTNDAGLPFLFIIALVVFGIFSMIGIFYSVLVATMVGQLMWQRHYHILAKGMLTKEYFVEDVDGEMMESALLSEHVQQLKSLGLL